MLECDPLKPNTGHLYLCQPHTVQIIQLVEATPPPRCISSVIRSSYPVSSSSSSSSYPSTSTSDEDCSSYCSSIVTPDDSSHDREPIPWTDDTYSTRMKRVHAWRDAFVKATCTLSGASIAPASPPPSEAPPDARSTSLKRKSNPHQTDDDTVSHTSKRSRSRDGHSISRLNGHPCPACDTLFPSLSSLRKHGHSPNIPEACRVAVDYNFE
ncbi:hypothetical protein OG21DRAFT_1412796 [Imleria badia]|nr:hypothetical protein OG21DRAFT_1412796 [Imleria badia]